MIRHLASTSATGLLHLVRDPDPLDFDWRSASREHRALLLSGGELLCAESDVPAEQLGPRLVRTGILTADELDAARRSSQRLGEVLLLRGVRREDLARAMADQLEEILLRALRWDSGRWRFEALPVERPPATARVSTRELLLRVLRRADHATVLAGLLGELSAPLVQRATPTEVMTLALQGIEGYLLTRADGTATTQEILAIAPGSRVDAERGLAVLLGLGLVERGTAPVTHRPAGVRPPAVTVHEHVAVAEPVQEVPKAPPAPAARAGWGYPAPAVQPRLSPAAFRRMVNDAWRGHEQKDHYTFLGVPRTATAETIEAAYAPLATRFRPDDNRDGSLQDLRDKLVALYLRAGEAHAVLVDAARRAQYDAELSRREDERALAARQAATLVSAVEAEPTPALHPVAADGDTTIRRAEELLAQESYWDAIQLLEQFQAVAEGAHARRCRLLLAGAYLRNPRWARQAESLLRPLLEADPNDVEALVLAARSCRSWARPRAATLLARALKLRPDHREARAELQSLEA